MKRLITIVVSIILIVSFFVFGIKYYNSFNSNFQYDGYVIDTKTGKGQIVEKEPGKEKVPTDTQCYLTSACMSHYLTNFDDNCYELTVLRWFRDNFVSKEDIKHYYKTAPMIVEAIEKEEHKDIIYNYIYDNVVDACVDAIENGDYDFAYNRYKESILSLEQTYLKINLEHKLVRTLKKQTI